MGWRFGGNCVLTVAETFLIEGSGHWDGEDRKIIGTQMHADPHRSCERAIRLSRTASHSAGDEDGVVAIVEG